jgi:hypothetical protein
MAIYGYCGLDCEQCEGRIATINNDDNLKAEIAKKWSADYGSEIEPSMINCEGCSASLGDVPRIGHCAECEIRLCAIEKEVEHCGVCPDFACDTVKNFAEFVPGIIEKLEGMK